MLCVYRVRRTSPIVFIVIHTLTAGMLLYPVCVTTKTAASHTAPHHSDNQIRFLPTPLQTRHYAQTEFPLHFVPKTTFHPFRNRETYLFIFIFLPPPPIFPQPVSHHYTLASRSFSYNSILADITLFKGKKKFCSSVNEPHTIIRTLSRFASLNIAFHKLLVTAYTTVSDNRFIGLLIFFEYKTKNFEWHTPQT